MINSIDTIDTQDHKNGPDIRNTGIKIIIQEGKRLK